MYAPERQQAIAGLEREQGRVSVVEIAARFEVTTETVRRDLAALERGGLVHRVHGGAVAGGALSMLETEVAERDRAHAEQKDRIAKAALGLLPSAASAVLLDAGTTTMRLAALLPSDRPLTVLTNSVSIAHRLAGQSRLSVHLIGGRVRSLTQACVGQTACASAPEASGRRAGRWSPAIRSRRTRSNKCRTTTAPATTPSTSA